MHRRWVRSGIARRNKSKQFVYRYGQLAISGSREPERPVGQFDRAHQRDRLLAVPETRARTAAVLTSDRTVRSLARE